MEEREIAEKIGVMKVARKTMPIKMKELQHFEELRTERETDLVHCVHAKLLPCIIELRHYENKVFVHNSLMVRRLAVCYLICESSI